MRLADTHCHLNLFTDPVDLGDLLDRAWNNGLDRILIPGTTLKSSQLAIELTDRHPNLFAAVGVHPNEATSWDDSSSQRLEQLARHPKVVAIGEVGLDYYRKYASPALQQKILEIQLNLATKLDLPVIIHSRQSLVDLWPLLFAWQAELVKRGHPLADHPGVLHSFEGTLEQAQAAMVSHFLLGITGPVTFKNAQDRQELVRQLPLVSLLVETDSPYLTPHPFRGQRNEPAHVLLVAEKIAELHGKSTEEVTATTSVNADRLFSWRAKD